VAGIVWLAACGGGGSNITAPPANTPPKANFGVSCAQLTCSFSDSSTDAEGSIKAWMWNFGDSTTGTDQNPVHTYAAAQSYNATLTVTDSAGATDSITKPLQPQAPSADLTCVDAATAGAPATCSFTLPQAAGVRAVLSDRVPCQAHGDVFAFTAPVADTLTADGCFAPIGTQVELASSPSGTQVAFAITSGLSQYMTGVRVTGTYPEWTVNVEDAVGAPFPANFTDMIVKVTALPSGP
jgi:PKD repeat protein